MDIKIQKPFEKPDAGPFLGTIIDVVDKPQVPVTFNGVTKIQDQVTFVWVLSRLDNSPALDSDGRPFRVFETYNAFLSDTSKLMKGLTEILNQAPPVIKNTDQLVQLLLGRSSQLFLQKTPKIGKPGEFVVKILGHSPLSPGQVPPQSPQGFVRAKDRVRGGQQSQSSAPPTPLQTAPAIAPVPSAALPNNNVAF